MGEGEEEEMESASVLREFSRYGYERNSDRIAIGQADGSVLIMEGSSSPLLRAQLGRGSARVLRSMGLLCVSHSVHSLSPANSVLLGQLRIGHM